MGFVCVVAGMVTLQNLQNLANLQNLPQVASLAAGLQGMTAGLTNNQLINTPLNLTVSSSGKRRRTISVNRVARDVSGKRREKDAKIARGSIRARDGNAREVKDRGLDDKSGVNTRRNR